MKHKIISLWMIMLLVTTGMSVADEESIFSTGPPTLSEDPPEVQRELTAIEIRELEVELAILRDDFKTATGSAREQLAEGIVETQASLAAKRTRLANIEIDLGIEPTPPEPLTETDAMAYIQSQADFSLQTWGELYDKLDKELDLTPDTRNALAAEITKLQDQELSPKALGEALGKKVAETQPAAAEAVERMATITTAKAVSAKQTRQERILSLDEEIEKLESYIALFEEEARTASGDNKAFAQEILDENKAALHIAKFQKNALIQRGIEEEEAKQRTPEVQRQELTQKAQNLVERTVEANQELDSAKQTFEETKQEAEGEIVERGTFLGLFQLGSESPFNAQHEVFVSEDNELMIDLDETFGGAPIPVKDVVADPDKFGISEDLEKELSSRLTKFTVAKTNLEIAERKKAEVEKEAGGFDLADNLEQLAKEIEENERVKTEAERLLDEDISAGGAGSLPAEAPANPFSGQEVESVFPVQSVDRPEKLPEVLRRRTDALQKLEEIIVSADGKSERFFRDKDTNEVFDAVTGEKIGRVVNNKFFATEDKALLDQEVKARLGFDFSQTAAVVAADAEAEKEVTAARAQPGGLTFSDLQNSERRAEALQPEFRDAALNLIDTRDEVVGEFGDAVFTVDKEGNLLVAFDGADPVLADEFLQRDDLPDDVEDVTQSKNDVMKAAAERFEKVNLQLQKETRFQESVKAELTNALVGDITLLQSQLASAELAFGPTDPKVQELRQQLAEKQAGLAELVGKSPVEEEGIISGSTEASFVINIDRLEAELTLLRTNPTLNKDLILAKEAELAAVVASRDAFIASKTVAFEKPAQEKKELTAEEINELAEEIADLESGIVAGKEQLEKGELTGDAREFIRQQVADAEADLKDLRQSDAFKNAPEQQKRTIELKATGFTKAELFRIGLDRVDPKVQGGREKFVEEFVSELTGEADGFPALPFLSDLSNREVGIEANALFDKLDASGVSDADKTLFKKKLLALHSKEGVGLNARQRSARILGVDLARGGSVGQEARDALFNSKDANTKAIDHLVFSDLVDQALASADNKARKDAILNDAFQKFAAMKTPDKDGNFRFGPGAVEKLRSNLQDALQEESRVDISKDTDEQAAAKIKSFLDSREGVEQEFRLDDIAGALASVDEGRRQSIMTELGLDTSDQAALRSKIALTEFQKEEGFNGAKLASGIGFAVKAYFTECGKLSLPALTCLPNIFGKVVKAYNDYRGIATLGALFIGTDEINERKEKRAKEMCDNLNIGGTDCFISKICQKYPDRAAGPGIVLTSSQGGIFRAAAHIQAEVTEPIAIFNESGLEGEERLYKVTYSFRNPKGANGVNLKFIGPDKEFLLFNRFKPVDSGGVDERLGTDAFVRFSKNEYRTVCLQFQVPIEDAKENKIPQVCVPIVTRFASEGQVAEKKAFEAKANERQGF